jgi:hypothetical protein
LSNQDRSRSLLRNVGWFRQSLSMPFDAET